MYKCKWFLCWFCIVILLNSFVTTACVLNLWDFLHIRLYLLRQFYLFLSNLHASNSSCLTALARTSSTMLNRGGSGHPWLFFFFSKKAFSLSLSVFTLYCDFTCMTDFSYFDVLLKTEVQLLSSVTCVQYSDSQFLKVIPHSYYYKILAIFLLYNVSILYLIICISYLPTPILPSFLLLPLVTIRLNFLWY